MEFSSKVRFHRGRSADRARLVSGQGWSHHALDLYYALDGMGKSRDAAKEDLDQEMLLLDAYQKAWNSGNAKEVTGLYTQDAIREDSLFDERSEGKAVIQTAAESFLSWYPGARWKLELGFGEGRTHPPTLGGTFSLQVKDASGKACVVKVAVLLETKDLPNHT